MTVIAKHIPIKLYDAIMVSQEKFRPWDEKLNRIVIQINDFFPFQRRTHFDGTIIIIMNKFVT